MRIIFFSFLIFQISCKVNVAAQGTVNQPVPTINAADPAPVLASNEGNYTSNSRACDGAGKACIRGGQVSSSRRAKGL